MAVEDIAAGALHEGAAGLPRFPFVRRKSLAGIPQCIFPRCPIPLIAPRLKIGLGSFRQEPPPCVLKIGAGLFEGRRRAVLMLARMRAGIGAARPAPRIFVERNAGADLDRSGVDIAPIDVPAFVGGVGRLAAGEFGHALLKRGRGRQANRPCGICGSRSVGRGTLGGNLPRHKKTDISAFTEMGEIKCG
jgi:hypothetical protein